MICPLHWGMGHATRCVPIISHLLDRKAEVIIAAEGSALEFLQLRFPEARFITFPGFRVNYPLGQNMLLKIIRQSPSIIYGIWREHRALKKIIRDHHIDAVISDNRFGLWSDKAYAVYITHQIMIKPAGWLRGGETLLYKVHQWFIRHYDECWIPDMPGENNLSGDLGHRFPIPENGIYVGILSRFKKSGEYEDTFGKERSPELLAILSGPEPQRTVLEKILLDELRLHPVKSAVILRGLPGMKEQSCPMPGVTMFSHLPDDQIRTLICQSRLIVCRSGYSTLMDLVTLGRNAVLVATPGQTEQEYLANYLSARGLFSHILQKDFSLSLLIEAGSKLAPKIDFINDAELLATAIDKFLEKIIRR